MGWHKKKPGACSLPLAELPAFTILVDLAGRASIDVALVLCLHFPQMVLLILGLLLGKTLGHKHADSCRVSSRCIIVWYSMCVCIYGTCVHASMCMPVILSLSHFIDLTQYLKEARGLSHGDFSKSWASANAFWEVGCFSVL